MKKLITIILAVAASVGTIKASVMIDDIVYNLNEVEIHNDYA